MCLGILLLAFLASTAHKHVVGGATINPFLQDFQQQLPTSVCIELALSSPDIHLCCRHLLLQVGPASNLRHASCPSNCWTILALQAGKKSQKNAGTVARPASAQAACLPMTLNRTCCNAQLLAPYALSLACCQVGIIGGLPDGFFHTNNSARFSLSVASISRPCIPCCATAHLEASKPRFP